MAENHTHYRDYRDLRGDGRIILYRRADNQGLNWSVRLKIPTTVGYVVKSAKRARAGPDHCRPQAASGTLPTELRRGQRSLPPRSGLN